MREREVMKLLNNIHSNHYNDIKNILLDADELKIVSPFLMELIFGTRY